MSDHPTLCSRCNVSRGTFAVAYVPIDADPLKAKLVCSFCLAQVLLEQMQATMQELGLASDPSVADAAAYAIAGEWPVGGASDV